VAARNTWIASARSHPLYRQADLIGGGFLLAFTSGPGQTWFIALFATALQAELALSPGGFGSLYSIATLSSGLLLAWVGAKVDDVPPRRFALATAIVLAAACLGMAAATHPLMLLPIVFLLRLTGQGLMSHLSMTILARGFDAARGRALGIGSLGFPVSQAILPVLATLGLFTLGWRFTWLVVGGVVLGVVLPLLALLLRRAQLPERRGPGPARGSSWRERLDLLMERRFLLLLPTVFAPSFVLTALFFHQGSLIAAKGWSVAWFATSVAVFAAFSLIGMLGSGFLVDRIGARRLVALSLLPQVLAMLLLAGGGSVLWLMPAMALAGLSSAGNTIMTAAFAELFGIDRLGTIRAQAASASVIASALSPGLVGFLLDAGVGIELLLVACAGLLLAAVPLAVMAAGGRPRRS
jgi:MFS family permease